MKRIWLRDARRRAKLTQEQLGEHVGKRQSYVARLESGEIEDPAFSVGLAIASVLGIDPHALRFGRKEEVA